MFSSYGKETHNMHTAAHKIIRKYWFSICFPFYSQKIPDNQCGGYGQTNGFGQSPVVLSTSLLWQCHTDMSGYEVFQGTCYWSDLQFEVTKHGEIFNSQTISVLVLFLLSF